jgi:hypothetical protein
MLLGGKWTACARYVRTRIERATARLLSPPPACSSSALTDIGLPWAYTAEKSWVFEIKKRL